MEAGRTKVSKQKSIRFRVWFISRTLVYSPEVPWEALRKDRMETWKIKAKVSLHTRNCIKRIQLGAS